MIEYLKITQKWRKHKGIKLTFNHVIFAFLDIIVAIVIGFVLYYCKISGLYLFVDIFLGIIIFLYIICDWMESEIKRIDKEKVDEYNKENTNKNTNKKVTYIYEIERKEFGKYLLNNVLDIQNANQRECIIKLIDEAIDQFKPRPYFKGGLLIAAIAPAWNWYLNYRYTKSINGDAEAFQFFIAICFMVAVIAIFWWLVKKGFTNIYALLANGNYNKYVEVKKLIQEIYIYEIKEASDIQYKKKITP